MIIDSHVHRYPELIYNDSAAWGRSKGENHWVSLIESPLQGWPTGEDYLEHMKEAGVGKVVLLGWYWENQETCIDQNKHIIEWRNEAPNQFIAFASVQPKMGLSVLEDLKRSIDSGIKGIGEVFPNAQGFSMQDPVWLKVVELAIEHDLPISMHVTEPVGHNYKGKIRTDLEDYQWLAKNYPELKLILAHWGGLLPFFELNPEIKANFKNVYYDTAASPLLYDKKVFEQVVNCIGSERILYGSDYPLRLYPSKQKEPNFSTFLSEINSLNLKEEDKKNILYRNAEKLLNL